MDCCFSEDNKNLSHIDHFTLACDIGTSSNIIDWYSKNFGMKRFFVNSGESVDDGFVISGQDIGMRMKAMEYWQCAESGLECPPGPSGHSLKIVVVEALPTQGSNHISTFLRAHGGPGVQHI